MSELARVALLIETDRGYGREVLRGIAAYARAHGPWNMYVEPGRSGRSYHLEGWQGDGIIAQAYGDHLIEAIQATAAPAVSVSMPETHWAGAHVVMDDNAIGRAAAEHLLERNFSHYAFSGEEGSPHSAIRGDAFCEAISDADYEAIRSESTYAQDSPMLWQEKQGDIVDWLVALPKPVGLFATNDLWGLQAIEAARRADVRVPEEVAIVGVANDHLLCELAQPPLSSVDVGAKRIGYRAAAALDALMAGDAPEAANLYMPPIEVVVRQSSDIFAVDDPELVAALAYIREHRAEPIGVKDVVSHVAVARRSLERRFKKHLGRTIQDEIYRVRVEAAKELLAGTDLQMPEVAERSGFPRPERLSEIFKRVTGQPPTEYRRRHRL